MKYLTIISIILITFSCTGKKPAGNKPISQDQVNANNHEKKDPPPENTLIVNENSVIFLFPDSIEIKELQAKYNEDAYNEVVADMVWYPDQASQKLDSLKIKNMHCDKEFIVFKQANNKEIKLKRKELQGNMVIFNVNKEPKISWAIEFNIDSVQNYLK
jgi:hypothetical protein